MLLTEAAVSKSNGLQDHNVETSPYSFSIQYISSLKKESSNFDLKATKRG
jgi:hypothetical protein